MPKNTYLYLDCCLCLYHFPNYFSHIWDAFIKYCMRGAKWVAKIMVAIIIIVIIIINIIYNFQLNNFSFILFVCESSLHTESERTTKTYKHNLQLVFDATAIIQNSTSIYMWNNHFQITYMGTPTPAKDNVTHIREVNRGGEGKRVSKRINLLLYYTISHCK